MKHISQTVGRWLMTGVVAIGALVVGARDATAAHQLIAMFNNPNPATGSCSLSSGGFPYQGLVDGFKSGNAGNILCSVRNSGGASTTATCPFAANRFDVYVEIAGGGGGTVAANQALLWTSGFQQWQSAVFHQSGCADIVASGQTNQ
jgi:hypothetical protein